MIPAVGDAKPTPLFWTGIVGVGVVVGADFLLRLAGDGVTPCGLDDIRGISPKLGSSTSWLMNMRSCASSEYF